MTDGGARAMVGIIWKRLSFIQITVALVGITTIIIGLSLGSPLVRIVSGLVVAGVGVFLFLTLRQNSRAEWRMGALKDTQSPKGKMTKLLFDDFQSSDGGKYVVKEIQEEESVVPSTKTGQPVQIAGGEDKVREFNIRDFFDLDSDIFRTDAEPKSEFNFLLSKVLIAMRDALFAHTVAFFWVNREKQQMVLEAKVTESQNFITNKRFSIDEDIVSQVAKTGKPQVLGRVSAVAEKEILCYYQSPEHIQSCVAVPVYYVSGKNSQLPMGVIVVDSKAEDAFGHETVGLLGNFTKLTSALIKSYTDKYDLLVDSELLSSLRRIQDRIKSDATESTVLNSLADEASRLVNWDYLTVTMYAEEHRGWALQKVVNRLGKPYVAPDQVIDFSDSFVGRVIQANKIENIPDLEHCEQYRFYKNEKIESRGSLLCLPVSSVNRCYGALTLESANKNNFSGSETETMYRLVECAASTLDVLYMNDLVKDFVVVDQLTGSLTKKHFMKKLDEEILRAEDFGSDLSFVTIAVDAMQDHIHRYGKDGFDSLLNQVSRIIRGSIRPYDVIGRWDLDRLGILLVNTAASDAYLWAEKIRKQIASHVITIAGKSFSVTVSAGVCGLSDGMHKEDLVAGTTQVLHRAIEGGGNLVQVY